MPPKTLAEKLKEKRQTALGKGPPPAKKARTEGASTVADPLVSENQKDLSPAEAVSSTPADRPIEIVGSIPDPDELEVRESPLKRRGKKKIPQKAGGSSAERWVPDFGKDVVYVTDSVTKPEVALKVARHVMLPADEEHYQGLKLSSLRKEFASAAMLVTTIGSALDAVHSVEAEDLKKQLDQARKDSQDVPSLRADLAAQKNKVLILEGAKDQIKTDLASKDAQVATLTKDLGSLRAELETAKKRAEDAEAQLAEEKISSSNKLKEYDGVLAANELTFHYWRPKIYQHGYDLCLNQVLAGANAAELPKSVEVPPGWWGDERDCLPGQDFDDFPPEEAPAEEATIDKAADI